jgi:hypothetical protein
MPIDVNPFEPWRPRPDPSRKDEEEIPLPQPPREVPRPSQAPENPETAWSQGRAERVIRYSAPGQTLTQKFVIGTFLLCLLVTLVGTVVLGGNHVTRVLLAALTCWLGLVVGVCLASGRRWFVRVGLVLLGFLVAGVGWVLVPTTGGVSLWEAYRRLAAFRAIPPGDLQAFNQQAGERDQLVEEFPDFRKEIRGLVYRWVLATVRQGLEKAEEMQEKDPLAAVRELRRLETSLPTGDSLQHVVAELTDARRKLTLDQLTRGEQEVQELFDQKRYRDVGLTIGWIVLRLEEEVRSLGAGDRLERLREIRGKAFGRLLDEAHARLQNLYNKRQYAAVAEEGHILAVELWSEANQLNLVERVQDRLTEVRRKALAARLAEARGDLEALFVRHDFQALREVAHQAKKELRVEAATLGQTEEIDRQLLPVMRRATEERIARAARELSELLDKGQAAMVPARADQLTDDLLHEAAEVGYQARLLERLTAVRRQAFGKRLDQARQSFQARVKADRYEAIGELGREVQENLGEEARVIGCEKELKPFCSGCAVWADLAQRAKKAR